mmetsp:Transcript_102054/g.329197  ORF Transcript_102054/g.329197 Transcript_102054/m.329197 type:complete len:294 (-) Transcript_102054:1364-2245(-)
MGGPPMLGGMSPWPKCLHASTHALADSYPRSFFINRARAGLPSKSSAPMPGLRSVVINSNKHCCSRVDHVNPLLEVGDIDSVPRNGCIEECHTVHTHGVAIVEQLLPFDEEPCLVRVEVLHVRLHRALHGDRGEVRGDAEEARGAHPDAAHSRAVDHRRERGQGRVAEDGSRRVVASENDQEVVQPPNHILPHHDHVPTVDRKAVDLKMVAPQEEWQLQEEQRTDGVQDLGEVIKAIMGGACARAPSLATTLCEWPCLSLDDWLQTGDIDGFFPSISIEDDLVHATLHVLGNT